MSFAAPSTLALCSRGLKDLNFQDAKEGLKEGLIKLRNYLKGIYSKIYRKYEGSKRRSGFERDVEKVRTDNEARYGAFLRSIAQLQASIEIELASSDDIELSYDSIVDSFGRKVNWAPIISGAYDVYDTLNSIDREYQVGTGEGENTPLAVKAIFDLVWYGEIFFYKDTKKPPKKTRIETYIDNHFKHKISKDYKVVPQRIGITKYATESLIEKKVHVYFFKPNPDNYSSIIEVKGYIVDEDAEVLETIQTSREIIARVFRVMAKFPGDEYAHIVPVNETLLYLDIEYYKENCPKKEENKSIWKMPKSPSPARRRSHSRIPSPARLSSAAEGIWRVPSSGLPKGSQRMGDVLSMSHEELLPSETSISRTPMSAMKAPMSLSSMLPPPEEESKSPSTQMDKLFMLPPHPRSPTGKRSRSNSPQSPNRTKRQKESSPRRGGKKRTLRNKTKTKS